jgi:hypothetical protein
MSQDHDTHDSQLEEIVAYLDGELSGEESAHVERRLAADEDYRQQLQGIDRAWHALDDLPMATVDDRFSRTTLTMVVEDAAKDIEARTRALPVVRRRRWLATLFGAAAAAALGFVVFRLAWPNPNQMLAADLAVIDNVDIYSQFQDVDFLRTLHTKLGDDLANLSGDARDLDARREHFAAISTPQGGREWLGTLNDEQRANLRAKFNRFRDLGIGEQGRLRKLHDDVVAAGDADQLERTMLAYQQWLSGLPPVRQFELRNIADANDRVELINRWAGEMRDDALLTLDDKQLERFFNEIREPMNELRESVLRGERRDNRGGDKARFGALLGERFQRWRRELKEQFDDRGRPRRFNDAVLAALPEESREQFAGLSPDAKVERFLTWMRQHTVCQGEVTRDELEQFFSDELDPEMQEQLLSLPPGEMEKRLRQMYRCPNKFQAQGRWLWEPNDKNEKDDDGGGRREDGRRDEGDRGRDRRGADPSRPAFGPPVELGGPSGPRGFGPSQFRGPPPGEPGDRGGHRPPPGAPGSPPPRK